MSGIDYKQQVIPQGIRHQQLRQQSTVRTSVEHVLLRQNLVLQTSNAQDRSSNILEKFKENDADTTMSDLDTAALTNRKPSHHNAIPKNAGVVWNHTETTGSSSGYIQDRKWLQNAQTNDDFGDAKFHPHAHTIEKNDGKSVAGLLPSVATFSPFVKKIQYKIQSLRNDTEAAAGKKLREKQRDKMNQLQMFLISETRATGQSKNGYDNENESPFIDHPNKILIPKKRDSQVGGSQETRLSMFHQNSDVGSSNPELNRRHHIRLASVKISLTPAQRFEKRPGTRSTNALENFQFGPMVGKGAFASVYKGTNLKTNQIVAIKQIVLEPDQNVGDLMGEIDLLKILKHPNIVKYHGFVKTSTSLNVFLEYCSGGSLRQLYKRLGHGLSELLVVTYVRSILRGLEYLHDQGVVHRDVKAANVLIIEETKEIKLADFGVATKVTNQYETVVGTPNWMAPETVLGGDGICTASDIWSLGATIIELFTMYPPYHDLNPMATLHAIGTDEHPPIPKSISQLALLFLLECFQKQPTLRKSAKLLLKHKWIQGVGKQPSQQLQNPSVVESFKRSSLIFANSEPSFQKSINSYSENLEEDNWDEFNGGEINEKVKQQLVSISPSLSSGAASANILNQLGEATKLTKKDLLTKFLDNQDEEDFENTASDKIFVPKIEIHFESIDVDEDPFQDLDIDTFDTNELEVQSKMDYFVSKFSKRVDLCFQENSNEIFTSLIKITGKMLHFLKKYPPTAHDVLIREHGILTILELLEYSDENPQYQRLWYHCLAILNQVFSKNIVQFENFCLLGGIPMVTKFRKKNFNKDVRLQVVLFIKLFYGSEKALSMFISSGGLRILSKFVEEDYDTSPEFLTASIHLINDLLSKDLTRSKSDICRILSKYGVAFWFAVVLNRLIKESSPPADLVCCIVNIFKYFGQSEAKVRINLANTELFKLLIKLFDELKSFDHQLMILKFLKSMSEVSDILRKLYKAEILEFLVRLLGDYLPLKNPHYKEIVNIICPLLYNCCYLNHTKELEIVNLGVIPHLKILSKINLPFRQFVLPILCELVYCDTYVKQQLQKHDILSIYFTLLVDPYWQSNALDSILNWGLGKATQEKYLETPTHIDCFIAGFLLPKVSNLESTLTSYLKLLGLGNMKSHMFKSLIIKNISTKLTLYNKNSVILLLLLRILRVFVLNSQIGEARFAAIFDVSLIKSLSTLKARESSVLVDELASEVIGVISDVCGGEYVVLDENDKVLETVQFE